MTGPKTSSLIDGQEEAIPFPQILTVSLRGSILIGRRRTYSRNSAEASRAQFCYIAMTSATLRNCSEEFDGSLKVMEMAGMKYRSDRGVSKNKACSRAVPLAQ